MTIDKDERKWTVKLRMDNEKCPHLFYPNVMHACKILDAKNEPDIRCRMELCPFFDVQRESTEQANAAKQAQEETR